MHLRTTGFARRNVMIRTHILVGGSAKTFQRAADNLPKVTEKKKKKTAEKQFLPAVASYVGYELFY